MTENVFPVLVCVNKELSSVRKFMLLTPCAGLTGGINLTLASMLSQLADSPNHASARWTGAICGVLNVAQHDLIIRPDPDILCTYLGRIATENNLSSNRYLKKHDSM